VTQVLSVQLGAPSCAKGGQIEIRFPKHIISYYLSGVTQPLIGPLPTFVSTVPPDAKIEAAGIRLSFGSFAALAQDQECAAPAAKREAEEDWGSSHCMKAKTPKTSAVKRVVVLYSRCRTSAGKPAW
jgi:hypothetical protein